MSGEWIKMRADLVDNPKLIAMARLLHDDEKFIQWLQPGGRECVVSQAALRCVTTALLLRVWSRSREHGEWVGRDVVLRHSTIKDLDEIAGAPGVGRSMYAVGWALKKDGVTLPNFLEHNVPMSAAEKQRAYRIRCKEGDQKRDQSVTEPLPTRGNENPSNVTPREEKRSTAVQQEHENQDHSADPPEKPGEFVLAMGIASERQTFSWINALVGKHSREAVLKVLRELHGKGTSVSDFDGGAKGLKAYITAAVQNHRAHPVLREEDRL